MYDGTCVKCFTSLSLLPCSLCIVFARVKAVAFRQFFENNPDSLLRMVQVRHTQIHTLTAANIPHSLCVMYKCADHYAEITKSDIPSSE